MSPGSTSFHTIDTRAPAKKASSNALRAAAPVVVRPRGVSLSLGAPTPRLYALLVRRRSIIAGQYRQHAPRRRPPRLKRHQRRPYPRRRTQLRPLASPAIPSRSRVCSVDSPPNLDCLDRIETCDQARWVNVLDRRLDEHPDLGDEPRFGPRVCVISIAHHAHAKRPRPLGVDPRPRPLRAARTDLAASRTGDRVRAHRVRTRPRHARGDMRRWHARREHRALHRPAGRRLRLGDPRVRQPGRTVGLPPRSASGEDRVCGRGWASLLIPAAGRQRARMPLRGRRLGLLRQATGRPARLRLTPGSTAGVRRRRSLPGRRLRGVAAQRVCRRYVLGASVSGRVIHVSLARDRFVLSS
jgi:hypothetical protein